MKRLVSLAWPCAMMVAIVFAGPWIATHGAEPEATLPGTKPLTIEGNLSAKMLEGLHRFAERKIDESVKRRAKLWQRDFSSTEGYEKSLLSNRERFRQIIGVVDDRVPVKMERYGDDARLP